MPISRPTSWSSWRRITDVTVLGIDPGSRVTGYGVIESDGVRSRHLRVRLHPHRGGRFSAAPRVRFSAACARC